MVLKAPDFKAVAKKLSSDKNRKPLKLRKEKIMSKLLYIQASPRGQRSHSVTVADAFIEAYEKKHPDDEVDILNVFDETIPNFDGPVVQAKYTILHGKPHTEAEQKVWKDIEKVIEQFTSADKYVLAVPMWNFSIPYRLKQYIDILVQPGYTFSYSPEAGSDSLNRLTLYLLFKLLQILDPFFPILH